MRFILYSLSLFLFSHIKGIGQEVTVYGQQSLWNTDAFCDFSLTCDYENHVPDEQELIGYAYHPNGDLWLVASERNGLYRHIYIYQVDQSVCQYRLISDIEMPYAWLLSSVANIDHLGRLYLVVHKWDSLENRRDKYLCRIADLANPDFEELIEFNRNYESSFWEVHFTMEKVYLVAIRVSRIWVYDWDFNPVDTIFTNKHIWGITSFSDGCDSLVTYATHMGHTTEEYLAIGVPDTMMYLSQYDLATNTLTPVCQYWMGDHAANTNMTSPLEFLSSDPECDLLIDLDRDNSTGVFPYDYLDSNEHCFNVEAPICEPDVYIHSSAPIDSIVLILSGIKDAGDERLTSLSLPPEIIFSQRNDSTYVMVSDNPTDDSYKAALLALRYQHSGASRTPGPRMISLQGFNAIKEGITITATIHINGLPFAGTDVTLLLCTDTLIQDFSTMTGGQPGGYWSPGLSGGGDVFNSSIDATGSYQYIVSDPVCGNDSATVTIIRDTNTPTDLLGQDQVLCSGDTLSLSILQNAQSIVWEDGTMSAFRLLTAPGLYWVSIEMTGGCVYRDSMRVTPGAIWNPDITTTDPICGQSNGVISFNADEFELNGTVFVNGLPMVSPVLDALPQGTYEITTISKDGCELVTETTLTNEPALLMELDSLLNITQGLWQEVAYAEVNGVDVTDVLFSPGTDIRWTGADIEVFGSSDIRYEITFVDENGCIDFHILNVKVEKQQGIYIPNVFNPASTSGNEMWRPSISESYIIEVLRIYDRWGNIVHQSSEEALWDGTRKGKPCAPGVFIYQLNLRHIVTGERIMMNGDISLVR
jgi:gliding motility-associated-like protein